MTVAVVVRPVAAGDAAALREVRLRALRDSPAAFTQPLAVAEAEPPERWDDRVDAAARGDARWLVAVDGTGRFVGLAGGIPLDGRIRVISVWVDPAHRGAGAGTELVRSIADWARARSLDCQIEVAPGNGDALRLYLRLGFEPVDDVPPHGCDVVLVRRWDAAR